MAYDKIVDSFRLEDELQNISRTIKQYLEYSPGRLDFYGGDFQRTIREIGNKIRLPAHRVSVGFAYGGDAAAGGAIYYTSDGKSSSAGVNPTTHTGIQADPGSLITVIYQKKQGVQGNPQLDVSGARKILGEASETLCVGIFEVM